MAADPMTTSPGENAMLIDEIFHTAYRELEERMKALAEADGLVFLPNPEPLGRVHYILICMEPSWGRWTGGSEENARLRVEAGFRNFLFSTEDFIVHFCVRHYLCGPTERYHITDFSKGAMRVKDAARARSQRYDRWYPLLVEEIELLCASPSAGIVAFGKDVSQHLARRNFRPFSQVIHYSPLAGLARKRGIVGREDSFQAFIGSVSLEDVFATAKDVLNAANTPSEIRDDTLARLAKSQLTTSHQQLIFNYKVKFESMRS